MKMTFSDNLRRNTAATAALAIFAVSLATLAGAWFFQFVLKLPPCPLCLEQRIPYYVVIPLSLLVTVAAHLRAPRSVVAAGFAVLLVAMLVSAALGAYHAGVEWRFWAGPTDCSGPVTDFTTKGPLLEQLRSIRVVRCDEAAWRFLGISLAGYNVLVSLALAAVAAFGFSARNRAR
jgi:disulfide bond formation protein DsbB